MQGLAGLLWRVALLAVLTLGGLALYSWASTEPDDEKIVTVVQGTADQSPSGMPDPKQGMMIEDIWKPAPTPVGGTSWDLLESTQEDIRVDEAGFTLSKPLFPAEVQALNGKRIKVAGWMRPLEESTTQSHFVLLGYPPGCPFHFHAGPAQFIEVRANIPFETNTIDSFVVSGTLELTGYDESGIFYRMVDARPG